MKRVRALVEAVIQKVSHAPISVECLFSMTLLQGRGSDYAGEEDGGACLGRSGCHGRLVKVVPRLTPG
jgi:hypothetical protein